MTAATLVLYGLPPVLSLLAGTGSINDVGYGKGKHYTVNVPLQVKQADKNITISPGRCDSTATRLHLHSFHRLQLILQPTAYTQSSLSKASTMHLCRMVLMMRATAWCMSPS